MTKLPDEQKVLKLLKIKDFRHLTKDKAIKLVSMLDKMDPEVAKKVLDQFPDFAKTMKEIVMEEKETLQKAMEENSKSVEKIYSTAESIINTLENELKNESLSFEEKKYIIAQLIELQNMINIKDSENKKFIAFITTCATICVGIITVGLNVALGGKAHIDFDQFKR